MNRTISTSTRRWLSGALIVAASAAVLLPGTAAAEPKHAPFGARHATPQRVSHAAPQQRHAAPQMRHAAPPVRHAAPPVRHAAPARHIAPPARHAALPARRIAPPARPVVRAPAHRWQPGHWVPVHARRPVHNWRAHRLPPPAYGHQWVQLDGGSFAQIALSTGLITLVINA